jgi:hypothetical protein
MVGRNLTPSFPAWDEEAEPDRKRVTPASASPACQRNTLFTNYAASSKLSSKLWESREF